MKDEFRYGSSYSDHADQDDAFLTIVGHILMCVFSFLCCMKNVSVISEKHRSNFCRISFSDVSAEKKTPVMSNVSPQGFQKRSQ